MEIDKIQLLPFHLTDSNQDMNNKIKIPLDNSDLYSEYSQKSQKFWKMFSKNNIISTRL